MLQGEHSAILSTFIKLPFVIKIFLLSILRGHFTQQGFFQPFWEGALGPFALGNFRHFNRNWENFFIHFYIIFLNRDPKTVLNHSYS